MKWAGRPRRSVGVNGVDMPSLHETHPPLVPARLRCHGGAWRRGLGTADGTAVPPPPVLPPAARIGPHAWFGFSRGEGGRGGRGGGCVDRAGAGSLEAIGPMYWMDR